MQRARGAAVLAQLEDAAPGAGHALVRADLSLLRETARVNVVLLRLPATT